MEKVSKVTIVGDIMCEPGLLAQAKTETGYDFLPVFAPMKSLFAEADYVIGNLETPLAGEAAGYTDCLVSFNTPDAIAEALKAVGMDMVSTANNHCLDRDLAGNIRTLEVLDRIGLAHTGTYRTPDEKDRIHYFTVNGTTVAVIAYTYATNKQHKNAAGEIEDSCVNRLKPVTGNRSYRPNPPLLQKTTALFEELLGRKLSWEENIRLKKTLGVPIAYPDSALEPEKYEPFLAALKADIEEARKHADLILFLPHTGGQFNTEPGVFSTYVVYKAVEFGADAVYAAHSHTTQKAAYVNDIPCFYSLGNFSMWPHSLYSVRESLPEYGLAAHAYLQDGKLVRSAFSIFKIVQDEGLPLSVVPVDELLPRLTDPWDAAQLEAEVGSIYTRVTGKPAPAHVLREYDL